MELNKNEKKRNILIGVGIGFVLVGAGTGIYMSINQDKQESSHQEGEELNKNFFAYTKDGVVSLYHTEKKQALSTLDLKKLKTNQAVDENVEYIYSKSEDLKELYAYNDSEKTFYRISVKGNEIVGQKIYTDESLSSFKEFKVIDNQLLILSKDKKHIIHVNLSENNTKQELELNGAVTLFTVKNDVLYYAYDNQLGQFNLKNNEHSTIQLGDKSVDYAFSKDKLYVLNAFGSHLNNSILMEIDLSNMLVNDLVELKSNQNAIFTQMVDGDFLYVGQIKTSKENKKEDVVLPIKTKSLSKKEKISDIPFHPNAIELDDFVYEYNDGQVEIYSLEYGDLVKEIQVDKAVDIMPLS